MDQHSKQHILARLDEHFCLDEDFRRQMAKGVILGLEKVKSAKKLHTGHEISLDDVTIPDENEMFEALLPTTTLMSASNPLPGAYIDCKWWAFTIVIPEKAMNDLNSIGDIAGAIAGLCAVYPPMAPIAGAVAAGVAIRWVTMRVIDQGKGIYITSPWPVPLSLIPTPIT